MNGLLVESVDALTLDEALLLARDLPHLGRLIQGELDGVDAATARRLVLGVLNIAQGNPKMLHLADKQAADPQLLAKLVESGDQAWRDAGGLPEGFFATGRTTATSDDYLQLLAAWTQTVTNTLTPGEQALFWYLCCLEEPDRIRLVLDISWPRLWARLGHDGPLPGIDETLAAIVTRGLAAVQHEPESYTVHPGVAFAGRAQAGRPFRDAADFETIVVWTGIFDFASGSTGGRGTDTRLMIRAGLGAVAYLLRQQQWSSAGQLLGYAFVADPSPANAAAILPTIQEITTRDPSHAGMLAQVLQVIAPEAAEPKVRAHMDDAVASDDYRAASVAAGQLIHLCRDSGRLSEALTLSSQKIEYNRQARLGPWTQLLAKVLRLQVLSAMGEADQVLTEVQRLRDQLPTLPTTASTDETTVPWNVRELLLDTGVGAAIELGRSYDVLDMIGDILTSKRERHAPDTDVARTAINAYGPLLKVGRISEALRLLQGCRQTFLDAGDVQSLGTVLTALANTEAERGHSDTAVQMEHDALRYKFLAGDVREIAGSYNNLGYHLHKHLREPTTALACHLAAALIRTLTSAAGTSRSVHAAAADLTEFGPAAVPPADVPSLCRAVGDIPGAELDRLITALAPDPETAERALRQLIEQARAEAAAACRNSSNDVPEVPHRVR